MVRCDQDEAVPSYAANAKAGRAIVWTTLPLVLPSRASIGLTA